MTTTTYESCTTTYMFACGMRDGSGRTYGTAHERKVCSRYVFHPDGTFTSTADLIGEDGTYRVFAGKVRLNLPARDDIAARSFELVLSPDGSQLGGMKRLPR